MKLWLLMSRFETGGLERVQANLATALAGAGLDISIVVGRFLPSSETMLPHGIPTLEIAPKGRHAFIPGLLSQLHRHRPDIVMTTSSDVACLVLIFRRLFRPDMKVICTQHLSVSAPWRQARGPVHVKLGLLLRAMRCLLPEADAVIAVSQAVADDMHRALGLKSEIHVIHNPVVLPDFEGKAQESIDWPWSDRSIPTVVFAGRLAKVKRIDLLMDAFRLLVAETPARLLILGDGSDRRRVRRSIETHRLEAVCHLAGYQANPLPWMRRADLLVLPSDHEGFGNVLVEAMACGTQVVSTDCPDGPAEILGHGCYGQLVPTGDIYALADAMRRSLSGEFHVPAHVLIRRAGEFDLDRATRKYLSVIHAAADGL